MAEIFPETGQPIDVAIPPPSLIGNTIPAIDNPNMVNGFGLNYPWGGGGTTRTYQPYGISAEGPSSETQLRDISSYLTGGGGDITYNFEGMIGPQGPPGRDGLPGITTIIGMPGYNSSFLVDLPDTLEKINDLGTAADKFLYTSAYTPYRNDIWTEMQPTGAENTYWQAFASNSDGSVLVAAGFNLSTNVAKVYLSTDSGDNWSDTGLGGDATFMWSDVAVDSDGSHILVVTSATGQRKVYLSNNSGVSFNDITPPLATGDRFSCGAMDADGSHIAVGEHNGRLWTSENSGSSWTERRYDGDLDRDYFSIAMDNDGSVILVTDWYESSNPGLWLSVDSGVNWVDKTPGGAYSQQWWRTALSSDGSVILAINKDTTKMRPFLSTDTGANWTEVDHPDAPGYKDYWKDVAVDGDGTHLIMGCNTPGRLYVSIDGGTTWVRQSPNDEATQTWLRVETISDGSIWLAISHTVDHRIYKSRFSVSYNQETWAESTITPAGRSLLDDTDAAAQAATLGLGTDDSVTHSGLTLTGLSASQLVATDGDKALVSLAVPLIVGKGGTGAVALTNHGLLLGSGTDAVTPLAAASNGQLPIGSAGADPVLATLTEGAGITITNGAGSITIASSITQYTDELAQDAVGGILDDGTVGGIVFTYDDNTPKISATVQAGEVDHDALNNTHNLTTDIDHDTITNTHNLTTDINHDALTNFTADEHFLQSAITEVGTIATGTWEGTSIGTAYTDAKCTDATADNTAANETSHTDVVVDGDFTSNGILNRTGAGAYSILALGTDVQAYHANLAAIAGGTWTGVNSITTLGTIATGTWEATDIAVAHGGTGASSAADARTNLGLVIGTNVLAQQTIGIADNNLLEVDDADAADDDYAKFTANGLEGRNASEVIDDLGLGQWTSPSFNAGDFTSSSGSWTVAEGDIRNYSYMIIGKTMYLNWDIITTSVSGTPGALRIAIPASKTSAGTLQTIGTVNDNGGGNQLGMITLGVSSTYVTLYVDFVPNLWSDATNTTNVFGNIVFEIN